MKTAGKPNLDRPGHVRLDWWFPKTKVNVLEEQETGSGASGAIHLSALFVGIRASGPFAETLVEPFVGTRASGDVVETRVSEETHAFGEAVTSREFQNK